MQAALLTNPHKHKEPRAPASKVDDSAPAALHKVIRVRAPPAYPVRQRREHVCRDDEKRQVVVPERGGEDHEEEADG